MRVVRHVPNPPPTFTLHFSKDEGWAIVAALHEYADAHPYAHHVDEWRQWAKDIDRALRHP